MEAWVLPGGREYPHRLVPKDTYRHCIDFDDLLSLFPSFRVVRRSHRQAADIFNDVGMIRADVLQPIEVPGMSLYMWCAPLREKDIHFIQKKPASNLWPTECLLPPAELMKCVDYRDTVTAIYFRAADIHHRAIPYYRSREDKEAKGLAERLRLAFPPADSAFEFDATIRGLHVPVCLNYWHAEIRVQHPEGKTIENVKSTWKNMAMKQALELLLNPCASRGPHAPNSLPASLYDEAER